MRHKTIKTWVIALTAIFTVSLIITAVLFVAQILPDIANGGISGERYEEQWTLAIAEGGALEVDVSAVDVFVETYSGTQVQAAFEGTRFRDSNGNAPYLEASDAGGSVRLKETQASKWFIIGPFSSTGLSGTLTIQIPKTMLGDVTVQTFSGGIRANGINAETIQLDTSSGNIKAEALSSQGTFTVTTFSGSQTVSNFSARETTLDASSGEIDIRDGSATSLHVKTFSGGISLKDILADKNIALDASSGSVNAANITADSLNVDTFSGRIALDSILAGTRAQLITSSGTVTIDGLEVKDLSAETFSGGIRANGITADIIRADTSSGDCELTLAQAADITVKTFSGRASLMVPEDMGFTYEIDTFSGSIDVDFPSLSYQQSGDKSRNDNVSGTVGGGEHKIYVETSSGGVSIQPAP